MGYWDIVFSRLDFIFNAVSVITLAFFIIMSLLVFAISADEEKNYFKNKFYKYLLIFTIIIGLLQIFIP